MAIPNRFYHLGFSYFNKIGPVNLDCLEKYFKDLRAAFTGDIYDLEKAGLRSGLALKFVRWRRSFCLEKVIQELEKEKINFITWHDSEYPKLLKEISAPPPILYYKGSFDSNIKNHLAVVGSRRHSSYAEKVISDLLSPVAGAGIEIISGLALGVDGLAHQVALTARGRTIAILGSGLRINNIYPLSHRPLAERIIASGGAIISEFPPETHPYRQNFPQRNRIIAGLAQATLVIESKEKSGSLITAAYALEQNREVLAVPGNIFSEFSAGPNGLIRAGAKVIMGADDILEVFKISTNSAISNDKPIKKLSTASQKKHDYRPTDAVEAIVYNLIRQATEKAETITTDEIIKKTKLDTATINSTLSMLELAGIAKNTEYGYDLN